MINLPGVIFGVLRVYGCSSQYAVAAIVRSRNSLILGVDVFSKLSFISAKDDIGLIDPQSCVAIYLVSIKTGNIS